MAKDKVTTDKGEGLHSTPENQTSQDASTIENISILENANVPAPMFNAATLPEPEAKPLAGQLPERGEQAEKRGRKKKYATPEEAAEAKRQRDRERYLGGSRSAGGDVGGGRITTPRRDSTEQSAQPADPMAVKKATAKVGAQTVVFTLDILRNTISGGEVSPMTELREQVVVCWEGYLLETGAEIPAWMLVTILSTAYMLPALSTPTAKTRVGGLWAKFKGWYVSRRG